MTDPQENCTHGTPGHIACVDCWQERVAFLEARVKEKDAALVDQLDRHVAQDKQWGQYCSQFMGRIAELEAELAEWRATPFVAELQARVKELEAQVETLKHWGKGDQDLAIEAEARVKELEATEERLVFEKSDWIKEQLRLSGIIDRAVESLNEYDSDLPAMDILCEFRDVPTARFTEGGE